MTSGSIFVTAVGVAFVPYGVSAAVRFGGSAAPSTVWISGSSVVARCGAGLGGGVSVAVSVGVQGGSLPLALSYNAVRVSSVSLLEVAASGASLVDIWGRSIGVFGESATSRIGGSASTSSAWAADSVVACRAVSYTHLRAHET